MRLWVRRLGALALAAAAITVWLVMAPEPIDAKAHADEVEAILAMAELNNDSAEGAAQQDVVNGWATRDLLALLSAQIDEDRTDERPVALLALLVLGAALALATSDRTSPQPA